MSLTEGYAGYAWHRTPKANITILLHTPRLLPVWERRTRSSASRNLKSIHRSERGKLDGVGAARIAPASRASATMC